MKASIVPSEVFNRKLISTVVWSMVILILYGCYSIFEPALFASTAAFQLEDTIVEYSLITNFLYKGGIKYLFGLVWTLGMIPLWWKIFFGKEYQQDEQ